VVPSQRVALLVAAVLCSGAAQAAPKDDLRALRGRLEALRKDLTESEQTRAEAADQLRESELAISTANRNLRKLAAERTAVERELVRLEGETRSLEAGIGSGRERLAAMLYRHYVRGRADHLRLFVTEEDPNRVSRELRYLGYVSRAQQAVIDGLRADLDALERIAGETRARREELATIERRQEEERRQLEKEKAARQAVLEKVAAQVTRQRQELATLQRDEARLTRLVERLARELARRKAKPPAKKQVAGSQPAPENRAVPEPGHDDDDSGFRQLKGRLRLPVTGELVSRFGGPRSAGGFSTKGVFIRSANGQEVRAIAAGRVVFADWLRGFGNLLIVDHGDGFMSLYGNNESLFKQTGESVRTGEAIAAVGASGGNQQTGLYFELRHRGKPVDPLQWAPVR
jgi:septal ring factor EnvC (AmiA/AmiB activator)